MANRYMDKAVYIRETTNGKTRWVKIPGVTIQNGYSGIRVYLDKEEYEHLEKGGWRNTVVFEREGRAE